MANRYRFAHEVIEAVRPAVPADRLLTFRVSDWGVADPEVSLFETREDWQQVIDLLDAESPWTPFRSPATATGPTRA